VELALHIDVRMLGFENFFEFCERGDQAAGRIDDQGRLCETETQHPMDGRAQLLMDRPITIRIERINRERIETIDMNGSVIIKKRGGLYSSPPFKLGGLFHFDLDQILDPQFASLVWHYQQVTASRIGKGHHAIGATVYGGHVNLGRVIVGSRKDQVGGSALHLGFGEQIAQVHACEGLEPTLG